ncbi:MAG: UpxY family transcription antiterminator [bacterium]|nr:UpxY family transcription antiterminator [bacterium]
MIQTKAIKANWYLIYTNPRAEKKVEAELLKRGYQVFLPMQKTLKQWSDRKKWVEEPLFKSYLFIYIELEKFYYNIISIHGIVKFVKFQNEIATVDAREIELVKLMLGNIAEMEVLASEIPESGDEIEIIAGPLIGTKGKLIKHQGNKNVLISLETMQQNLALHIQSTYIRKIVKTIMN